MRVSFVVLIVFVLAFGILQLAMGAISMSQAGPQPNVGWNTRPIGFMLGGDDPQPNVGWNSRPTAYILPVVKPCVGWNS
jgi:hypothetical protein